MSTFSLATVRNMTVPVIVVSEWFGTSLWFSPSGVAEGMIHWLGLSPGGFGLLLAATQLGFISGTLLLTLSGWADRFHPERIFALSSVAGAVLNCAWTFGQPDTVLVWMSRFAVGMTLAGIYPMGMKMIVQRAGTKPGWALAWLVAMLTLGTASPQFLRFIGGLGPWQFIVWGSSALALLGACLVLVLPSPASAAAGRQGSAHRHPLIDLRELFRLKKYRASCGAYVGHMWELYAFWGAVPFLVAQALATSHPAEVAAFSGVVISAGALGCVLGGIASRKIGSPRVAAISLFLSGTMCAIYPFVPAELVEARLVILIIWGVFVVSDSPQFSAMTSTYVPPTLVGTALTAQNCVGFFITVISILVLQKMMPQLGERSVWMLLPGPLFGLMALRPILRDKTDV